MTVNNFQERKIIPTHPGEMLLEDFLQDYSLTTSILAKKLGVSCQTINELLRERRAVSPAMALRLSRLFCNCPEFWLNAQLSFDLWKANKISRKSLNGFSQSKQPDALTAKH